ncbi:futalosine hydrolase [Paenibacillus sp. cl141a]|uniref:futalosine hydrolase n=1 Tax=Paenibacillus sp. cl141a TaxID=1761877 RepID=UPI0008C0D12A|nr:futalosine hydrolase [Paenibacillus sp. cl141a]SEL69102.1 futalosine hydrolase [Paenibacillus sp. cl141a]
MQKHTPSNSADTIGSYSSAPHSFRRVLIVTAVDAEKDAVLRGLKNASGFEVIAGGVGPAATAAATARRLMQASYDFVVSAGIAGGFAGQAEVGSIVIADLILAADLGSETEDGFSSVQELGFGTDRIPVDAAAAGKLAEALEDAGAAVTLGPVLTVSTTTGTAATAASLLRRVPNACAEAMEGFGVATAADAAGVPVLEIRTISNQVGPRDRGAWKIKEALQALETASSLLPEVLR